MTTTYPIPEALDRYCHGSGHVLAAVLHGQLVAFRYFADMTSLPVNNRIEALATFGEPNVAENVRYLQSLGEVVVGTIDEARLFWPL